jgi:lysophospholipase L1-like esterase
MNIAHLGLVALLCISTASAEQPSASSTHWVSVWGCSAAEPFPAIANSPIPAAPRIVGTIRYRIPIAQKAKRVVLRVTNEAGTNPLVIGGVSVGLAGTGTAARPGSIRRATFGGRPGIEVPIGAPVVTDALDLSAANEGDLLVSIYVAQVTELAQGQTGLLVESVAGRDASLEDSPSDAKPLAARPLVSAIYAEASMQSKTIVTLGDSITDGAQSASSEIRGWPGQLARRLAGAKGKVKYSVSNQGIGGNRLLQNGIGPNALARFDRDVSSQPNVSYVILLEGINDIGLGTGTFKDFDFSSGKFSSSGRQVSSQELIAADEQLIERAHAAGMKIIGGTILPFKGSFYFSEDRERVRVEVNEWIRHGSRFDAIIDFDQAVRDKNDPSLLAASYDSGDKLHPGDVGYAAMGNSISLKLFAGAL